MTRHPAILEAAAVSVPDAKYGEVVGAWIVRQPDGIISRDEVRKCVSDNMNPQVSYPHTKRLRILLWGIVI
jgi:acyl-CoA synthetase (AMP-forming)/AMP-acid ligase II